MVSYWPPCLFLLVALFYTSVDMKSIFFTVALVIIICPPLCKGRWFSQENRRDWLWWGIDFGTINWFASELTSKISYVNKMFFNLSVSYADSSLYQREPCNSFGLKCWFTTKQVQQREPCFVNCLYLAILPKRASSFTGFKISATGLIGNFSLLWLYQKSNLTERKFTNTFTCDRQK